MIEGVGIDVVNIDRFKESLERTPGLSEKLFTESERTKNIQKLYCFQISIAAGGTSSSC